jgi:hypothetical protein
MRGCGSICQPFSKVRAFFWADHLGLVKKIEAFFYGTQPGMATRTRNPMPATSWRFGGCADGTAEAFKGWEPGMRVPKCRRCKENLQPEENHICDGFVPEYPTLDMEAREDSQDSLRQDRMARDRDIASDTFGAEEPQ